MNKHIIMGTAGHVDHGKTALIKALTNFDCDTHKEEKKRGITINLGFTHINHPDGSKIGVVDVPGHKDFINTMISGATGINFALFVIAADSGIMPQTKEHLYILNSLGIKNGIIALTKSDLSDPLLIDIAKEEIKVLTTGTFLENAPIQEVSSVTGQGIGRLKKLIFELSSKLSSDEINKQGIDEPFRMYIDRWFSLSGIGSVITGSIINGMANIDTHLYLLPSKRVSKYKIKGIQKYGKSSKYIIFGERAAINLSDLKKEDYKKGMLLSDKELSTSCIFDATVVFLEDFDKKKKSFRQNNNEVMQLSCNLLIGTLDTKSKINLLFPTKNSKEEKTFFTQIRTEKKCILRFEDKFILRNSSGDNTIGYGYILNPSPLNHKRRTKKLLSELENIETNRQKALIESALQKYQGITDASTISHDFNFSITEIKSFIDKSSNTYQVLEDKDDHIFINKKSLKKINKEIPNIIKKFHIKKPLLSTGITNDEIINTLKLDNLKTGKKLVDFILKKLEGEDQIIKRDNTWCLTSHKITIDSGLLKKIDFIENYLKNSGMTVPLIEDLKIKTKNEGIFEKELYQILKHLSGISKIYKIDDNYIHASIVDSCRKKLVKHLENSNKGITVAEFRDLVSGNRKICLLLLSIYDKEKTTIRKNDFRYLA